MAEEFRLDELRRDGRTVHRDEGIASTRERMDGLCQDFLPGAALSEEQHGDTRSRHRADVPRDIGERARQRPQARWVRLQVARVDERRSADRNRDPEPEEGVADLEAITIAKFHGLDALAVLPRAVLRIEVRELPAVVDESQLRVLRGHPPVGNLDRHDVRFDADDPLLAPAEAHPLRIGEPVTPRTREGSLALQLQVEMSGE